jgi:hypothetical protein
MPEKKKTQKKKTDKVKKEEKTKEEKKTNEKKKTEEEKKINETEVLLPPLDFSSIILPFYTQAVIKLGLAEDPLSKKEEENLELAKRLIDLLDLIKERTEGNLKPEEEKFLIGCIHQLKMAYMDKAKIINL